MLHKLGGDRERVDILALVLHHDEQAVLVAVEMALAEGVATKSWRCSWSTDLRMGLTSAWAICFSFAKCVLKYKSVLHRNGPPTAGRTPQ
jgi:hypothetical protein|tara:strand:+ start:761 stop:1030 length:270 start_codon:yes stop_codon:yes gene_type:complete